MKATASVVRIDSKPGFIAPEIEIALDALIVVSIGLCGMRMERRLYITDAPQRQNTAGPTGRQGASIARGFYPFRHIVEDAFAAMMPAGLVRAIDPVVPAGIGRGPRHAVIAKSNDHRPSASQAMRLFPQSGSLAG